MTLKREDIKKLVIQQMLQESVQEEGAVTNWLKSKVQKMAGGGAAKTAADGGNKNPNRKIEGVADFLQQAQRSKELTALISNTKVGQAAGMKPVQEALGGDFVKQMRQAKITDADLDEFIGQMSKNATAKKILDDLGLTKPDSQPQQQPAAQSGETKPATAPQQAQGQQSNQTPAQAAQQARKDKASQTAQSANKGQAQAPDAKNLQAVINKVRNPQKETNQILTKQPIMARLSAAGFTPQQAKFVSDEFIKFLKTKVSKTAKGAQIKVLEQEQPSSASGHNNLRVFDNSNRSVMGQLIALMKKAIQDPKFGKATKPINDTTIAGLAKELAKDIANQARISAGLSVDNKDSAQVAQVKGTETPKAPAQAESAAASLTAKPPPQPQAGDYQGQDDAYRIRKINDMLKDPQNSQKVSSAISQGLDPRTGGPLSARATQVLKQHYGLEEPAKDTAQTKDAETAAKMASEKNPNPPTDSPRTQSSTIPQPAAPIKIQPPVEDSTGKPAEKPSAKSATTPAQAKQPETKSEPIKSLIDKAWSAEGGDPIRKMPKENAFKILDAIKKATSTNIEEAKSGTAPSAFDEIVRLSKVPKKDVILFLQFLNKNKKLPEKLVSKLGDILTVRELKVKDEKDPEIMKALGTPVQESLKEILIQEIYNSLVGKIK